MPESSTGPYYGVDPMVLAGEALRPFPCPAGSAQTPPPVRQPLTVSALHAEVPGHTFYWGPVNFFPGVFDAQLTMFVSADGVLYSTFKGGPDGGTEHDVGTWRITADGQFGWHIWGGRLASCSTVYRDGESFEFSPQDRFVKAMCRRAPGNPEGY